MLPSRCADDFQPVDSGRGAKSRFCRQALLDAIEDPHQETRELHSFGGLDHVVVIDLAVTGRVAKRRVGTDEERTRAFFTRAARGDGDG